MQRKYTVKQLVVFVAVLVAAGAGAVALAIWLTGGVEPDDQYRSASDLASTLDSEGFRCTEVGSEVLDNGYAEEVSCAEGLRVAVWENSLPEYADGVSHYSGAISLLTNDHLLRSDTWIIRSSNPDLIREIAPKFGGDYYGTDDQLQCDYNPNTQC